MIVRFMQISLVILVVCFFFKQKTAYEMRISDWSSDVCSSDLSDITPVWTRDLTGGSASTPLAIMQKGGADAAMLITPDMLTATAGGTGTGAEGSELGRAACRARVCQSVLRSVVSDTVKQNT